MGRRPPERNPAFMKIIVTDFPKKLMIPPKFVRLHRGTLARKCILRPTGTRDAWLVRTKQINDSLYFKKGWKKFAQHYSLGFGDLLAFRYAKDCEFHVDVFDKSCCLKELAGTSQHVGSQMDTTSKFPRKNKKLQTKARPGKALEAENIVSSLPKYPSCPCVMNTSYLHGRYLHVPPSFSKQMKLKEGGNKVKLECRGKHWDAVLSTYRKKASSMINGGWSAFVKENALQIGDTCVLELIDREDALIRVTIFECTN